MKSLIIMIESNEIISEIDLILNSWLPPPRFSYILWSKCCWCTWIVYKYFNLLTMQSLANASFNYSRISITKSFISHYLHFDFIAERSNRVSTTKSDCHYASDGKLENIEFQKHRQRAGEWLTRSISTSTITARVIVENYRSRYSCLGCHHFHVFSRKIVVISTLLFGVCFVTSFNIMTASSITFYLCSDPSEL